MSWKRYLLIFQKPDTLDVDFHIMDTEAATNGESNRMADSGRYTVRVEMFRLSQTRLIFGGYMFSSNREYIP